MGGMMKDILDQMEEHIAAIRNLQRSFDFHSKRLEKLMRVLSVEPNEGESEIHRQEVENTAESSMNSEIPGKTDLVQRDS